jgi:nucleoside-diphosphate-sugar epimerase
LITVVGADGLVGGGIAKALAAKRVVYGPVRNGDVHISQAESLIRKADVIVNAGGFRIRPGCAYADYQRSHQGASAAIAQWVHKGALFVHISSNSVLGKSKHRKLGNQSPPNPHTYPSPSYALAKWEADRFLEKESAEREFRLIFLRPTTVYSPGAAGMVNTMLKLAKRGIILRLYPRDVRHHLCHLDLLAEVARRVIQQYQNVLHLSRLVVADPEAVTNQELEAMILQHLQRKSVGIPVPVKLISAALRHSFHSKNPRWDLRTWGEIFGVLDFDTEYDPSETFRLLGIDPSRYSLEKTLKPLIREALQQ